MKTSWHAIALTILIPITLFLISAAIIAHTSPLIHSLIDRYSRDPVDAHATMDYYYTYIASSTNELPVIPGMTDAELQHLKDVRSFWRFGLVLAGVSLVALGLLIWRAQKKHVLARGLEWGSMLTIASMIGASLVPFDSLWTGFHQIAFPQGNWVFAYNSRIITLFPGEFFQAAVLRVGLLTLALGIVTYIIAFILMKVAKKKAKRDAVSAP